MTRLVSLMILAFIATGMLLIEACRKSDVQPTTAVEFKIPDGWPSPQYNFQNNPLTQQAIALGQKLYNADGSATSLEQVTLNHITTATEMGETIEGVLAKLRADNNYPFMFKAAFGNETIDAERLSKSISQFVLTMVSNNSKYDKV